MKLLMDQNLSYRMLEELQAAFPASSHVRLLGLDKSDDRSVWQYAKDQGFVLVTLDSDFHELAMLHGVPPKIVWLKCGNRPRWYIANLLLRHQAQLKAFDTDPNSVVLEIY